MNRNEEYESLLEEFEETPVKLDFTLDRARARRAGHRRRIRKAVFTPLGTVAAVLAVFMLLVNISPTFAYAAGRVPMLRDLAKFVALSPSLSAAVENEYVQPMGLEQTADGITAKIEYVIVDLKQLNIFYTLSSATGQSVESSPEISGGDGSAMEGFSIMYSGPGEKDDSLRKITVDFSEGTMPDSLTLTLLVYPSRFPENSEMSSAPAHVSEYDYFFETDSAQPEVLTQLSFKLRFDPTYTDAGEIIPLDARFTLDGQELTLVSAEIYPTHMRFVFDDSESNTAWLESLGFYVENEKGERFEGISNGVSAFGKPDSPMMATYMLESAFFSKSKHLTLHITSAVWLDKNMERVRLDLDAVTAEALPEGVEFVSTERRDEGWLLEFTAEAYRENFSHQVWQSVYYDSQGEKHNIDSYSFSSVGSGYSPGREIKENSFGIMLPLKDYFADEVWLCPSYSRYTVQAEPVILPIK
ncbi:MAG: DUF4179 domain-containing protein [Oscillospiraceae bacterium]|nr:DUF4179 domain-containing protein [Oscillospiraceae bacterium]